MGFLLGASLYLFRLPILWPCALYSGRHGNGSTWGWYLTRLRGVIISVFSTHRKNILLFWYILDRLCTPSKNMKHPRGYSVFALMVIKLSRRRQPLPLLEHSHLYQRRFLKYLGYRTASRCVCWIASRNGTICLHTWLTPTHAHPRELTVS